jgi:hypothetical protein
MFKGILDVTYDIASMVNNLIYFSEYEATFWKSASVFSLIKMHIVCYVLHAKFDVLVKIHVILLNISDNYDNIRSLL